MCGIIGGLAKNGQNVNKSIWKRYLHQKGRGSDGFGFVTVNEGKVNVYRSETEKDIHELLLKNKSSLIMFHHRYPTSTINCVEATHPILVSNNELEHDYMVIHNGVLLNENELKKSHNKLGYEYTTEIKEISKVDYETKQGFYDGTKTETLTFNDSESFAIDLARYLENKTTTLDSVGSIAFMCFVVSKAKKTKGKLVAIYYGHNDGNPLHIEENKDFLFIKSVGGTELETDTLYKIDTKTGEKSEEKVKIGRERYSTPTTYKTPTHSYSEDYKRDNKMGFGLYGNDDSGYSDNWDEYNEKNKTILSPYALNDKEEGFIKSSTERWVELDDMCNMWSDFAEGEQEKIATGKYDSPEELKKLMESRDDALYQIELCDEKKQDIEAEFYARYGADIDFYDYIEESLYEPNKHF